MSASTRVIHSSPAAVLLRVTLALMALVGLFASAWAEPEMAHGSRIAMEVPEGFEPSLSLPGFVADAKGASIQALEVGTGKVYDEWKTNWGQPEPHAGRRFSQVRGAELPGRAGDYAYEIGTLSTERGDYTSHRLLFRQSDITCLIEFQISASAPNGDIVTVEQIERALLSATVKPDLVRPNRRWDFYHLGYLGPFAASLRLAPGITTYAMSPEQPKFGSQKANPKAIFMVAALPPDKVPPGDVRQAAQHMFRSYAREPGQVIRSEKEVNIAGMRGYAISGEGRGWAAVQDELTGYYCVVLAREQEGYYLLMGAVPVVDLPPYLPEFEKIARSFQPQATR